jgi:hypothetical protein
MLKVLGHLNSLIIVSALSVTELDFTMRSRRIRDHPECRPGRTRKKSMGLNSAGTLPVRLTDRGSVD